MLNFSKGKWDKLKKLILIGGSHPFIADKGCKYLSRASLPKI
jgi:hypothetical protein